MKYLCESRTWPNNTICKEAWVGDWWGWLPSIHTKPCQSRRNDVKQPVYITKKSISGEENDTSLVLRVRRILVGLSQKNRQVKFIDLRIWYSITQIPSTKFDSKNSHCFIPWPKYGYSLYLDPPQKNTHGIIPPPLHLRSTNAQWWIFKPHFSAVCWYPEV